MVYLGQFPIILRLGDPRWLLVVEHLEAVVVVAVVVMVAVVEVEVVVAAEEVVVAVAVAVLVVLEHMEARRSLSRFVGTMSLLKQLKDIAVLLIRHAETAVVAQ